MSTPTGGPINPIDSFPHAAHETRERADAQQHAAERDSERTRSAYAPKKPRTLPPQRADVAINEDVAPLVAPRQPDRPRQHSEHYAVDNEAALSSHDPDSSLEPARPQDHHRKQPSGARRDSDISDLRRLETTLRWIQREEVAVRIPRAAQLPPVPGLARADIGDRSHGDESSDFRLPRSLEPERMAPPPSRSRRPALRALLTFLIATILAALTGYYLWTGYWSPRADRKWPPSLLKVMRRPPSGRKNSCPRRPKTAIVPSRSSARHPLSVRRSYSYQTHPKASLWRCCSRARPANGLCRPVRPVACLIQKRSNFS